MTAAQVETTGLTKVYGNVTALDSVDLRVPEGSVYGLVGPNGSGKTTMLSILVGLRRQTSGSMALRVDRKQIALVPDTPRFEPWLTARETVDLARHLSAPELPESRVLDALGRTGLRDAADRRVGGFSRGMLQRLGLATAVVSDPRLLVLDEPASALDPAGRREVLDLVASLHGSATVLFSSHILGDVQEVCDRVGILREGRLLFQGGIDELLQGRAAPAYAVRLRSPLEPVMTALRSERWVTRVDAVATDLLTVGAQSADAAESRLPAVLARAGARMVSVTPVQADLESVFLELTR
jgi:ABC-2 type transport system ATP-binding protein